MNSCLAKTRSSGICQLIGNPKNGRCQLHGGASTGPRTAEGRARVAAAQYKHGGRRSQAFVAAQRARNARGKAIKRELKSIENQLVFDGLLPKRWERAFRLE